MQISTVGGSSALNLTGNRKLVTLIGNHAKSCGKNKPTESGKFRFMFSWQNVENEALRTVVWILVCKLVLIWRVNRLHIFSSRLRVFRTSTIDIELAWAWNVKFILGHMNENLTPEQAEIFQFARSGHNILITGTVVWSLWKERLKEGRKRTVLADN